MPSKGVRREKVRHRHEQAESGEEAGIDGGRGSGDRACGGRAEPGALHGRSRLWRRSLCRERYAPWLRRTPRWRPRWTPAFRLPTRLPILRILSIRIWLPGAGLLVLLPERGGVLPERDVLPGRMAARAGFMTTNARSDRGLRSQGETVAVALRTR